MADLLAGTTVLALDTPPTVGNVQADAFTFTITAYGVATTGGTYNDCGVAFVAPTTGRVIIHMAALLSNTAAVGTRCAPVVRTGSTVGAGATILAASDNNGAVTSFTTSVRVGAASLLEGLTAGSSYNVRLEHRVTSNTGTASFRTVIVEPAT